jgi:hypothetical protein
VSEVGASQDLEPESEGEGEEATKGLFGEVRITGEVVVDVARLARSAALVLLALGLHLALRRTIRRERGTSDVKDGGASVKRRPRWRDRRLRCQCSRHMTRPTVAWGVEVNLSS